MVNQSPVPCYDVHRRLPGRCEVKLHRKPLSRSLSTDTCSVRSTNVYEELSLGVFHEDDRLLEGDSRIAIWGNYILQHASTQLSFGKGVPSLSTPAIESLIRPLSDMWWLALCMVIMCIIERTKLENVADALWFNIFSLSE